MMPTAGGRRLRRRPQHASSTWLSTSSLYTTTHDDNGERVLELNPASTMIVILLLLALGVTIASTSIVMYSSGDCAIDELTISSTSFKSAHVHDHPQSQLVEMRSEEPLSSLDPISTTSDNFPIACTVEQLDLVKKQLKPDECIAGKPWQQKCSFTQATRGCQDHSWMTQTYAEMDFTVPFVAIMVGWPKGLDKVDFFMTGLQLGTKDPIRYDADKIWRQYGNRQHQCRRQKPAFSGKPSPSTKVYVLESEESKINDLKAIQEEYKAKNELILDDTDFTESKSSTINLDAWIRMNLPSRDDPIHHLSVNVEGWDFNILMGASDVLNRVRYLDFEVQWKYEWEKGSLSILIRKLKTRGLVCYFSGSDGQLWRITDCWLDHYGEKHWGRIACVNVHHADAKLLLNRMETGFARTLTGTISYS